MFENKEKDAYMNRRYYGYSMDLITEIANLINITFEFQLTKDGSYLNLVNDLVERVSVTTVSYSSITSNSFRGLIWVFATLPSHPNEVN